MANQQIRFPEVRVIADSGEHFGVLKIPDALRLAVEKEMDLVLIDPKAVPPVCKIVNFGQFKYQKEKEERKKKAQSKTTEIKGLRLTPRIAEHDVEVRLNQALNFLNRGDKVQIEILMRGRDNAHPEIIRELLKTFIEKLKAVVPVRIEQDIQRQGQKFIALVAKQ